MASRRNFSFRWPSSGRLASKVAIVFRAIGLGVLIVLAGTIPRNILFAANLKFLTGVPWAVPLAAIYLWFFWCYLRGWGPPPETSEFRRVNLRARRLPARTWTWAMIAGLVGLFALVLGLRLANRMVTLPTAELPDLSQVPRFTIVVLLLASAPIAGLIEESAFRGYMQKPIEERYGLVVSILITGTMFALVHLDFTLILWPYYVAVAAIYGSVAYFTKSILPAMALHTLGNLYSNFDLLWNGRTDWQSGPPGTPLVWQSGADAAFWAMLGAFAVSAAATALAFRKLAAENPLGGAR